jgi:hypothetical protein
MFEWYYLYAIGLISTIIGFGAALLVGRGSCGLDSSDR